MRKKNGITKAAQEQDFETLKFMDNVPSKEPKTKQSVPVCKLATYLSPEDMIKFNNILAAKSHGQAKMLKAAEVLRELLLNYIKKHADLAR
jgi:hypothetical protein